MNRFLKRAITAGVTAATIAASGVALTASDGSAAAPPTLHTLRVVAHQTASHRLGNGYSFVGQDTDRRRSTGKIVGYDTISGHFFPRQNRIVIHVAVSLRGGILLARIHQPADATSFTGTVTGGRGKFLGARGTISGHTPPQSKNTYVTVHYLL